MTNKISTTLAPSSLGTTRRNSLVHPASGELLLGNLAASCELLGAKTNAGPLIGLKKWAEAVGDLMPDGSAEYFG